MADSGTQLGDPVFCVLDHAVSAGTFERLGDTRRVADRCRARLLLILLTAGEFDDASAAEAIAHGADEVAVVRAEYAALLADASCLVGPTVGELRGVTPRLIVAPGDAVGREWAARLAARQGWALASPALMISARGEQLEVTALDPSGRLSRRLRADASMPVVLTMRDGVGEPMPRDGERRGDVRRVTWAAGGDARPSVTREAFMPADPATADIRFASRLISGGRGLGGKAGFDALRRVARKLNAGVAASRMAVDLGWVEHARQVGQTGKTVTPDLYIACGISGASHHLDGMSASKHIVAINSDAQAPIFRIAHLGLVGDLFEVLRLVEAQLPQPGATLGGEEPA